MVDADGPAVEYFLGAKQLAVVLEAVHGDVESPALQLIQQRKGNRPVALGDKGEGGAEAELLLDLGQLQAVVVAPAGVHVVDQHQRELLAVRPAGPAGGRPGRARVDGPDVGVAPPLVAGDLPAGGDLERPGDHGAQGVEEVVA